MKSLEEYLARENAGHILKLQHDNPNLNLSKSQLNQIVRIVGDFARRNFGPIPTKCQREMVAKALIQIFPCVQMVCATHFITFYVHL